MIFKTLNLENFIQEFKDMNRDNFSYEGYKFLFEHFSEFSELGGIELDVIGICCQFSEISIDDVLDYDDSELFELSNNNYIAMA